MDKMFSTMPARVSNAGNALRHVFIRDFMVECLIGVYEQEKRRPQRVRINLDLAVDEGEHPIIDDILNVVIKAAKPVVSAYELIVYNIPT